MDALDNVEILLVEDSEEMAELTRRALKRNNLGSKLVWVEDGKLAIDFLFRQGKFASRANVMPRLVLLDLHLPSLDGHGVLQQMRANSETSMIPVVMVTTSGDDGDIATSYKLGANSYLVKPIDPTEFSKTMTDASIYWTMMNRVARRNEVPAT